MSASKLFSFFLCYLSWNTQMQNCNRLTEQSGLKRWVLTLHLTHNNHIQRSWKCGTIFEKKKCHRSDLRTISFVWTPWMTLKWIKNRRRDVSVWLANKINQWTLAALRQWIYQTYQYIFIQILLDRTTAQVHLISTIVCLICSYS